VSKIHYCPICRTEFFKDKNSFKKVCGAIQCALEYNRRQDTKAEKARQKAVKAKDKKWLNDNKALSKCRSEAQAAFNAYIRARDRGKPCISCDWPDDGSNQRHCSHYRSVGAMPALRYVEENCSTSCAQCNSHKSGNILEYRIRLVKKIGQARVDWLEGPHEPAKHTREQLVGIRAVYKAKLKELML
jgi:hypothetical protein